MPDVPFTLKTFGLESTRGRRANFIFTPSRHGAIGPDGVLVGRVVVKWSEIDMETGIGVAKVAQTTTLRPACHYKVSVEWIDDAPEGFADIPWPLHVPAEGGPLSQLLKIPAPENAFAVGPVDPGRAVSIGGWWLDNSTFPPMFRPREA
ncbi:hypothetical protein [Pseudoclavibacter sp. RFBB5]|uniref:hypothetical protein n=1 Tax=Pseudoclavibacter sp. RFBB5 TaxID=2080574 RepID=UPI000CE7C9F1|nr:hypothetical protein [Pseudoclavibacter sp. RFBB5]PPG29637.1 hypothetical protein C5B97_11740 [Pseudoclavibacter sp. RFBB5]